jgi:hypothetical protein
MIDFTQQEIASEIGHAIRKLKATNVYDLSQIEEGLISVLHELQKERIDKEKPMYKRYPEMDRLFDHYKGGIYKTLFMVKHSETNEDLVLYKSLQYRSLHARPLSSWFDLKKNGAGEMVCRFQLQEPDSK